MGRQNMFVALDKAVERKFPNVSCETSYNIFAMRHITRWWKKGTEDEKLSPYWARQVRGFVNGYMAAMEDSNATD